MCVYITFIIIFMQGFPEVWKLFQGFLQGKKVEKGWSTVSNERVAANTIWCQGRTPQVGIRTENKIWHFLFGVATSTCVTNITRPLLTQPYLVATSVTAWSSELLDFYTVTAITAADWSSNTAPLKCTFCLPYTLWLEPHYPEEVTLIRGKIFHFEIQLQSI
jgi:hypothetical protein